MAVVSHLNVRFRETVIDKDGKSMTTEYILSSRRSRIPERLLVAIAVFIVLAVAGFSSGTWSGIIDVLVSGFWRFLR